MQTPPQLELTVIRNIVSSQSSLRPPVASSRISLHHEVIRVSQSTLQLDPLSHRGGEESIEKPPLNPQFTTLNMAPYHRPQTQAFGYRKLLLFRSVQGMGVCSGIRRGRPCGRRRQ